MDLLDQILAEAEAETLVVEEPIKVDKETKNRKSSNTKALHLCDYATTTIIEP